MSRSPRRSLSLAALLLSITTATACDSTETPSIPVIQSLAATGLPASRGGTVTVSATAQSPEGLELTYAWTADGGFTIMGDSDQATVTLAAPWSYGASGMVAVTVTDSDGRVAMGALALSTEGNVGPIVHSLSAAPNPMRKESVGTITVVASDPNGDTLSYAWTVPPGYVVESGAGTAEITVRAPTELLGGSVEVEVGDGKNTVTASIHLSTREGHWTGARLVEHEDGAALEPDIAVAESGDAIAVWPQHDGTTFSIYAARYDVATKTFRDAAPIEEGSGYASGSRVAVDAAGNAFAVWHQDDGVASSIFASRYDAATDAWGDATPLESDGVDSENPDVAVDAGGNAFAVWRRADGSIGNLFAARYDAGAGTWSAPAPLEAGAGNATSVKVAVDGLGDAFAAWRQHDGTTFSIYANRYDAGAGTWGATGTLLETSDQLADAVRIAADLEGNALAVWTQSDGANVDVFVNAYDAAAGAFGGADAIGLADGNCERPHVAFDAAGHALVVWAQVYDGALSVLANRYDFASDAFATTDLLETGSGGSTVVALAADPAGNALAFWYDVTGASALYASTYTASTDTWGDPQKLEYRGGSTSAGEIAMDANGNGLAIWSQNDDTTTSIYVNRFE